MIFNCTPCRFLDQKRFPTMTVLPIAPLLAEAIHQVFHDGSVTSLFDGNA